MSKSQGSSGEDNEQKRLSEDFCARRLLELFQELPADRKEALMTRLRKQTYTPAEVAEILGKSIEMIRRYLRNGEIKGTKLGRSWVVSKAEVERFLKAGK